MSNPSKNNSCEFVPADVYTPDSAFLVVNDLSRNYSDKPDSGGLKSISFAVNKNEITAIIGKSGSGKSTLLRLIYGLLEPDAGEVRFEGWRVIGPSDQLIPGHPAMRMVSQHFDDLNIYANVYDNVASQLSNEDLDLKENQTLLTLKRLRIDHLKGQRIADLSGGEKQRVSIARALITQPKLLLMDEPFNQIDAAFRDELQRDLKEIVEETDLSVILVSHDPSEVLGMANQLVILRDGVLAALGDPVALYNNPPNKYVARMLAKSNILNAEEAKHVNVFQEGKYVAIHPEWIHVRASKRGRFEIKMILFRGFYEELVIQSSQLYLRVYHLKHGQLKRGDRVNCKVLRFAPIASNH